MQNNQQKFFLNGILGVSGAIAIFMIVVTSIILALLLYKEQWESQLPKILEPESRNLILEERQAIRQLHPKIIPACSTGQKELTASCLAVIKAANEHHQRLGEITVQAVEEVVSRGDLSINQKQECVNSLYKGTYDILERTKTLFLEAQSRRHAKPVGKSIRGNPIASLHPSARALARGAFTLYQILLHVFESVTDLTGRSNL